MSILIRTIQRAHRLKQNFPSRRVSNTLSQTLGFANRSHSTKSVTKSPFETNILRILRNEIEYQAEYAPPHQVPNFPEENLMNFVIRVFDSFQFYIFNSKILFFMQPVTEFNSFVVEDRPGEQVVTIRGKFGDNEDIKIEATMFDGFQHVPAFGDDSSGVNVRLHLSLIVDISKGEDGNELEFICSAWPDGLDVEKVFILKRGQMSTKPYLGPDFRFELWFCFIQSPTRY